jgi:hypothetical protein
MVGLLAWVASAAAQTPRAAPSAAGPVFAPVAHSALVAVEGAQSERTLLLRVRRVSDQQLLEGAALSVTLDGAGASVTQRPGGTWAVPLPEKPQTPGKLEIVVAHDGVREVLDGQLPVVSAARAATAAPAPATGLSGQLSALIHKQGSWWVLNILIVLIGVIAVSRRMS